MVHAKEMDFDKLVGEMRLSKIRQSSTKLTWEGFNQAIRRCFMEKSLIFDSESREEAGEVLNYMRKSVAMDTNGNLMDQLKQLADCLECSLVNETNAVLLRNAEFQIEIYTDHSQIFQIRISYFGRPFMDSEELKELLSSGDQEGLRSVVYYILNIIPSSNNHGDRQLYITSLELVEGWLLQQNKGDPTFERINTSPFGYVLKRDSTRTSRIYYFVDEHYQLASNRKNFDIKTDLNLPFLELLLVSNDSDIELPIGDPSDPWAIKKQVAVCYCLRFSVPLMLSASIWKQLETFVARNSVIRKYINLYGYTTDFDFKTEELTLRTNFPPNVVQHRYCMSAELLKEETDVVVGEIYIEDIRNLERIIALLRTQHMHNVLWESILCVTREPWKGRSTVRLNIWASATRFEIKFYSNERLYLVRIEQNKQEKNKDNRKWIVSLTSLDGLSVSSDCDEQLTNTLNSSHSIPCVVINALCVVVARGTSDPSEPSVDDSEVVSSFVDYVGDSWVPQEKKELPEMEAAVSIEEDASPMAFLAGFKDVEDIFTPLPTRPETLPRTVRHHSSEQSFSHAFSDLEAICQIADSWEGDSKTTTPVPSAKFDVSPAQRFPGFPHMSPLENARLRMANSVASFPTTPDIFDFSDDRSVGSGSSFPSPSPSSFVGSPSGRGGGTGKRRPRQRKAGNMGDRTGSTDSIGAEPKKQRTNRVTIMTSGRRGIRGSRKSSGLPHSLSEMERPQLQRSYSDFMATTPNQKESPIPEDDSDDEACDPPPPPKNLATLIAQQQAAAAAAAQQAQLAAANKEFNDPLEKLRVQPVRKTSLEILLGAKKPIIPPIQPRKSVLSDIYDDGLDSPPPSSSLPTIQPVGITPTTTSISLPTSFGPPPVLQPITKIDSPLPLASPKIDPPIIPVEPFVSMKPESADPSKVMVKVSKQRENQKNREKKAEKDGKKLTEKKKKETKRESRDRLDRPKEDSKRKRKGDLALKSDRDIKRHKSIIEPPKIKPALPFFQQTLHKDFKIPKKEDKDTPKDTTTPITPTTPAPPLSSPSSINPMPFPPAPSSGHTLPPMNKPIIKKNNTAAAIRLNLPLTQPATYLPKKISEPNRRSSGAPPSSHMSSLSSIPLPKGPGPDRYERYSSSSSSRSSSQWVKPPSQPPTSLPPLLPPHASSLPPPRSPSPDAMQIDESNSPEDSLRIAEE